MYGKLFTLSERGKITYEIRHQLLCKKWCLAMRFGIFFYIDSVYIAKIKNELKRA